MKHKNGLFFLTALVLINFSTLSYAQISSQAANHISNDYPSDWTIQLGVAPVYAPAFVGAKDYYLYTLPDISIKYKNIFFLSYVDGLGYNLINTNGWRAGPVANLAYERDSDGSSIFRVAGARTQALRGLGNVDTTLEVGGFAEYVFQPLIAKIELRQGVNGHKGLVGEAKLNYFHKVGLISYFLGPRIRFANAKYNNVYWGISPQQSLNSGLGTYHTSAAIISYGLVGSLSSPVNKNISFSVFAAYDRLSNHIAKSPLISERGSKNQYLVGLSVAYQFEQHLA